MVIGPTVAGACAKALAALCGVTALLFALLGLRQLVAPNDAMAPALAFLLAAAFLGGAMLCLWFAQALRRLTQRD